MYMIVLGEENRLSITSKKTFCLWYIYGHRIDQWNWRAGDTVSSLIDRKQQNAFFTNKAECDKVMNLYGLHLEDFDTPSEFCRKKDYDVPSVFWKYLANHLYQKRIWIHRSSDLKS